MPKAPPPESLPIVKISPRGATRLKTGHVWVYRSDIVSADAVPPGSARPRLRSSRQAAGHRPLLQFLANRHPHDLARARRRFSRPASPAHRRRRSAYREPLVHDKEAYRVIFSEADFLPGLIVDRYDDILSLQILTQAMDANPVRETVISELTRQSQPRFDHRARRSARA